MDIENLTNTIIEKDVSDELIWMTVSKYALFMSHGRIGIDAKALYEHYQFTCIMQRTNSVWASDKYCRQGLDWGRDRFEKAKALLLDLGLIEINQIRGEGGKFGKIYIRVRMKRVELEPDDLDRMSENRQAGLTASGKTTTNALTNNRNALTKKGNALALNYHKDKCPDIRPPEIEKPKKTKKFIPPTLQEVVDYAKLKGYSISPEYFHAYYEEKDWFRGKDKIKDWKKTMHTWNVRDKTVLNKPQESKFKPLPSINELRGK